MESLSGEDQTVGAEPALPDAELEVLACLWKRGEATARDVREAMAAYRPLTHSAVSTLLSRLQEKGLVARRKGPIGKAFLFRAVGRPTTTRRRLVGDLLERVFGGDALAVVSSLFETRPPNAEELDRLERLLDELRSNAAESASANGVRKKCKRR
jgi:BlaI family transcriptional regulator, penicillinase repressor